MQIVSSNKETILWDQGRVLGGFQLMLNHRRWGKSVQNKTVGERGISDDETAQTRALGARFPLGNEGRWAVWSPRWASRRWCSRNTLKSRWEEAQRPDRVSSFNVVIEKNGFSAGFSLIRWTWYFGETDKAMLSMVFGGKRILRRGVW